ncbi:MAG: hypothetical protein L0206_08885 [Actinobacteria bacterium]|nr:hypothetical protein [Actinomycetota bacterium]
MPLQGFLDGDASDELLFSADCGIQRTLAGGKQVRARQRLFIAGLKIYEGHAPDEMAGRLISGVRDIATRSSNEFVRIRAGGVVVNGHALLLPSVPEPHLPALVALLVRSGAEYLADEIVNLDPVLRQLHGSSIPLLLAESDLALFPELGRPPPRRRRAREGGAKEPRRPVRLEELRGRPAEPAAPARVIFPRFEPGGPSELRPIGDAEALFRFTQAGLNLHIWADRALLMFRDVLRTARVAELVVGSLPDGARLLLEQTEAEGGGSAG